MQHLAEKRREGFSLKNVFKITFALLCSLFTTLKSHLQQLLDYVTKRDITDSN